VRFSVPFAARAVGGAAPRNDQLQAGLLDRGFEAEKPPQSAVDLLDAQIPTEMGRQGRAFSAPPAAVGTLDNPFQSEKVILQEIDGELRRPGRAALRRERA